MKWEQFKDLLPVLTFVLGLVSSILIEWARVRWTETAQTRAARRQFEINALTATREALIRYCNLTQDVHFDKPANGYVARADQDRWHEARMGLAVQISQIPQIHLRTTCFEVAALGEALAKGPPGPPPDEDVELDAFTTSFSIAATAVSQRLLELHGFL